MKRANYIVAADALDDWRDDLLTGKPPVLYRVAESGPLAEIEIGPKLITLFGGAPGAGKTAFVMQGCLESLRLNPSLRAVVCNVEMPAESLLERQLSRLSGVPLNAIRHRRIEAEHAERIDAGFAMLAEVVDRLAFVRPPFDLANVAAVADAFAPLSSGDGTMIVLDYLQRIGVPGGNHGGDQRGTIEAAMNFIRQFADAGAAVVAVAAVGRQRDSKGRSGYSPDAMNLGSFRGTSELEFGADSAFILTAGDDDAEPNRRVLRHLKARHGELADIVMTFDGGTQRFDAEDYTTRDPLGLSAALAALWDDADADGSGFDG
jgi:replicative DNA helicase